MKKTILGFLVLLAIGINMALWLRLKNQPGIAAENGPMENFQVAFLALSFLAWLVAALSARERPAKIFLFALTLFHLSFFVHEVDLRKLEQTVFTELLNKLFHGSVRNLWLGALWLFVAFSFFKNMKPVWNEFVHWIKSPSGWLMILSGGFWIASGLNDKSLLGQKSLFREELMEVNSTPLMLLSAIIFLSMRRTSPVRQFDKPSETRPLP